MFTLPASAGTVLVLVLGSALLYPILDFLYNISPFHPLAQHAGPTLWKGSRVLWIMSMQKGRLHKDLKAFHESYGPVVRIAPNEISYIDARAWQDIYLAKPRASTTSATGLFERNPVWFRPMPGDPFSIMGSNETAHARYRRAFMPAFTDKALQSQEPILERNVSGLVDQLRGLAVTGTPANLVDWFNFLAFDLSAELSFGETFGSVAAGKAHPWVEINNNVSTLK